MKKRLFVLILCFLIFFVNVISVVKAYTLEDQKLPFEIKSKSAILMDASTGTILFEKNSHEKLAPASITKIMSLILFLEAVENGKINLNDKVIASEHASSMGGSQIFLAPGEEMTVEDLIKSVVLVSANDATVALAEYITGSEEIFTKMMNEKAAALNMKDTHFKNSTGLPEEGHYTSAYDVALMSRELIKHPLFFNWSTIWVDSLRDGKFDLVNTNKLIRYYKGADGVKTGSTEEAKFCLAATAKRGNLRLIAVVMGAPDSKTRFNEAAKLLDYGFANYDYLPVYGKNDIVKTVNVEKGNLSQINLIVQNDVGILVKKGEVQNIDKRVTLNPIIKAPIKKGQELGKLILLKDGKEFLSVPLVADRDVKKLSLYDGLLKIFKNWLKIK